MKKTITDLLFIIGQYLLPHHLVSRLVGFFAESHRSFIKRPLMKFFVRRFGIDMSEAERESLEDYQNFNDFFTRSLKPGIRPIEGEPSDWVSPVDARISQFGPIQDGQIIQAKGRTYSVTQLFGGDSEMAAHYQQGEFITLYLSPKDYHRIHMPLRARLIKTTFIPGRLFSVNPLTANSIDRVFARNERLVCEFESVRGRFTMVLVGAMVVASIETVWSGIVAPFKRRIVQRSYQEPTLTFEKGEEMGRFRLGSTVILLIENNQISWHDDIGNEEIVRLGQRLNTTQ